jgi:WD40 repeat protein
MDLRSSGEVNRMIFYESDPNIQCYNEAEAMIRTRDGDYLLVGDSGKDDVSPTDALVMKLLDVSQEPLQKNDPYHHYYCGPVKWIKTYAITSPNQGDSVRANTVVETQDGGYLVAGRGGVAGVWIMKLDSEGNILWHKELSNGQWISSCSLQATPDGGFILTGIIDPLGNVEVFKLDGNAVVQWHKSYVSDFRVPGVCDGAYHTDGGGVTVLRNGEYMLTGATGCGCDIEHSCFLGGWVCRLDESGEIIWQRGYVDSVPAGAFETADGGVCMVDDRLGGIMKLNASGDLQWIRLVSDEDSGLPLIRGFQNSDEGYVMGYRRIYYNPDQNTQIGIMRLGQTGMLETACPLIAPGAAAEMNPRIRVITGADLVSNANSVQVYTRAYAPFVRTCTVKAVCGSPANR